MSFPGEADPPAGRVFARSPISGRPPEPGGPPAANLAFLLINLGGTVRRQVDAALEPLGLSLRHLSALGHLNGQPGISYSEIARRAGVTPQSIQATLRQLEDLGAVERRTPAGRGRKAHLHVTAEGLDLLRRGEDAVDDADRRLKASLSADRQDELQSALVGLFLAKGAPIRGSEDDRPVTGPRSAQ